MQYGLRRIGYGLDFNTRKPTTDSADLDLCIEPECAPGLGNFKSMDWEQDHVKLILKFGTWTQGSNMMLTYGVLKIPNSMPAVPFHLLRCPLLALAAGYQAAISHSMEYRSQEMHRFLSYRNTAYIRQSLAFSSIYNDFRWQSRRCIAFRK